MVVGHFGDGIVARRPDGEGRKPSFVARTDCRYAHARMRSTGLQRLIVVALFIGSLAAVRRPSIQTAS